LGSESHCPKVTAANDLAHLIDRPDILFDNLPDDLGLILLIRGSKSVYILFEELTISFKVAEHFLVIEGVLSHCSPLSLKLLNILILLIKAFLVFIIVG
jgi:hypothetical protein